MNAAEKLYNTMAELEKRRSQVCVEYDRMMETNHWDGLIPPIKFPNDWEIQLRPPFGGATVRFNVRKNDIAVSVYLDCYDTLGTVGQPYWEIYPCADGDVLRFSMNDIDGLLAAIGEVVS